MRQKAAHTSRLYGKGWAAVSLLLPLSLGGGQSHPAPLPPERPSDLEQENRKSFSRGIVPKPALTEDPRHGEQAAPDFDSCLARLAALEVGIRTASSPLDDKACIIAMPIRIEHVVVRDGPASVIQVPDRPLIDCRMAEPLAHWVGGVVVPVFAASFSFTLRAVRTGPGYECRNRNREAAAKISAHATGLALDISSFELANGRVVAVGSASDPTSETALQTIRTAACGWFTTVLGPGSDAEHQNHLHLDIQRHGADARYRICE